MLPLEQGATQKLRAQACQSLGHVGPGVEPVPRQVELHARGFVDAFEAEIPQHDVEIAPVQRIELAESDLP